MSDVIVNPRFLALAIKAQASFSKASRMDQALEGQFCVHDMLDMLGDDIDRETLPKENAK